MSRQVHLYVAEADIVHLLLMLRQVYLRKAHHSLIMRPRQVNLSHLLLNKYFFRVAAVLHTLRICTPPVVWHAPQLLRHKLQSVLA